MQRQIMVWMMVLAAGMAHAATLEIPTPDTTHSGIGVISGWKCDAGELTVRFDGGAPVPLVYGARRTDVRDAGPCPCLVAASRSGIGESSEGEHTAWVYDDGVSFDRSTFTS